MFLKYNHANSDMIVMEIYLLDGEKYVDNNGDSFVEITKI